jgi:hypothetical protein
MRGRNLLVLLLILVVLLAAQWQFSSLTPGTTYVTPGSGTSVLVVAKANYVFARLHVEVQAFGSSPYGNQSQPVTLTFPNGTEVQITGTREFDMVLTNSVYYTFTSFGASGGGYSVSSSEPLSVDFLTGQNATSALTFAPSGIEGIDVYQFLITGDALIQVNCMWVRL